MVLVSGKGGVGKTTVAAATGLKAARAGHRALVVSLDRAHNLGDVLGVKLGASPREVPGAAGLSAMEADPQAELSAHAEALQGYFARLLEWAGMGGAQADEIAVLPGLEELLVLSRLAELCESDAADVVVVDLAPTASSLRLLAFPEMMAGPLGKLVEWERRFLRIARGAMKKVSSAPLPEEATYEAIDAIAKRLGRLKEVLADGSRAIVRLVSIPERVVLDETRSAYTLLSLFGLSVDAVVLNRVLPPSLRGSYLDGWLDIQAREMARAREEMVGLALRPVGFQPAEVIGVQALDRVGDEIYEGRDPAQAFAEVAPMRFEESEGTMSLALRLPLVSPGGIDLRQTDAELIVTVGAWRRQILLPTSLHGRAVTAARLSGGTLRIVFEPRKEQ
ncbi:MAG: ArsA family ATPase [Polyangiaceae bacterium]